MKLREIAWDPSMYKHGDENDPNSPYYGPRPKRRVRDEDSYDNNDISDRDRDEDRRTSKLVSNIQRQMNATSYQEQSGERNGKPYNLIVTFNRVDQNLDPRTIFRGWQQHNFNIYTNIVDVEDQPDQVVAYVNAAPQNLLWNVVRQKQ